MCGFKKELSKCFGKENVASCHLPYSPFCTYEIYISKILSDYGIY